MIKGIAMAQWVNRLQNNIFVNLPPLPLSCGRNWVLWQAGWQADEIQVSFEILKISRG